MKRYADKNGASLRDEQIAKRDDLTGNVLAYRRSVETGNPDQELFEVIWMHCASTIRAQAQRVLGIASPDVEDVTQNVAVQLLRHIGKFDGRSDFKTWLYRVSMNAALENKRSNDRRRAVCAGELAETMPHPITGADAEWALHAAEENERKLKTLRGIIKRMAPMYRQAIELSEFERKSNREIAEVQGVGVPAVKSRLHRARSLLRERMLRRYPIRS